MSFSTEIDKLRKLLRLARFYALDHAPYYGRALVAFKHRLAHGIGTVVAYVPPLTAYWDVDRLRELARQDTKQAVAKLAFGCVHLTCHFLRDHVDRCGNRYRSLWHLACDLEINDWTPPGLARPDEWWLIEPKKLELPAGRTAEWYYEQFLRMLERARHSASKRTAGSRRGRWPFGSEHSRPEAVDQKLQERLFDRFGLPETARDINGAPLSADGIAAHLGAVTAGQASTEKSGAHELQQIAAQIQATVARDILEHKARGTLPRGALRWAEQQCKPMVRWQERLRRAVRGKLALGSEARIDYCYARPHRKSAAYEPFVLPRLAGKLVPRVACVVDTSGSISQQELGQAVAELGALLVQVAGPIVVIPCDAVAYEPIVVRSRREVASLRRRLRGGGGTDMRAGLQAALQLHPPPTLVVVLTDGFTPLPHSRPQEADVLWVVWHHAGIGSAELNELLKRLACPPWRDRDFVFVPVG